MPNVNRRTILMTPLAAAIPIVGNRAMPLKISQLHTPSTPPTPPRPVASLRRVPLQVQTSIKLSAAGAGTASIGPTLKTEVWEGVTVAVKCATNVAEAMCRISVGNDASSRNVIDATTYGSTGASTSNTPPKIVRDQFVSATWTGGDANTTATLYITGHKLIP